MYPREYFDTYWRGDLKNEVFVIMSFADEFKEVWESAIRPAIEDDTDENQAELACLVDFRKKPLRIPARVQPDAGYHQKNHCCEHQQFDFGPPIILR